MKITTPLIIATAAVLPLASCSDHDPIDNPTRNLITFNASAPLSGRQVTTTEDLKDFKVWAFADGQLYMRDVTVNRTSEGWNYSPSMYWPSDAALNFYSYSPAIVTETQSDETNPDIPGFINGGKTDLLYAVNKGETRGDGNTSPVKINFRHALSQVRFLMRPRVAKAGGQQLSVKVKALDLLGTYTVGSFDFPQGSTTIGNDIVGLWHSQTSIANKNIFSGEQMLSTDDPKELNSTGYIFSIPQTLPQSNVDGTDYQGAYARVLCEIYDRTSGVKVWPQNADVDGAGYLYFPLSTNLTSATEWQLGKAYRYTLNIDVPAATSKIEFDVTVDEYPDFIELNTGN